MWSTIPETLWPTRLGSPSLADMPKPRNEDRAFALRLGPVLVKLRERAGWTREEASGELGIPVTTLGKWERGEHAPKAYDLGRLFAGYQGWGADPLWFLDPPGEVRVDPVRDRLDELEAAGAIAADEREARVAKRRQQNAAKRVAARRRPTTGTPLRSPR